MRMTLPLKAEITPMQRFEAFARAILAVPKEAILEAEAEHRRNSPRVKAAKKAKAPEENRS
jgi:hypothetical protein